MSVSKIVYQSENNTFQLQVLGVQSNPRIHVDQWDIVFTWTPKDFESFCESIESAQDAQAQQQDIIDSNKMACAVCGKIQEPGWAMGGFVSGRVFCQPCAAGRKGEINYLMMLEARQKDGWKPRIASLNGIPYDDRGDYKFPSH
jgi:hypothetical protein